MNDLFPMEPKPTAVFSSCRKYRYVLWRTWSPGPYVNFIGLNPSTADETKDDATIRVCRGFAQRWGFGAMCMTNLFAFRATDPKAIKAQTNPMGEDNMHHLLQVSSEARLVVAAWGCNGTIFNQDLNVKEKLSQVGVKLHCLLKTDGGHPRHPLRIRRETMPIPL